MIDLRADTIALVTAVVVYWIGIPISGAVAFALGSSFYWRRFPTDPPAPDAPPWWER